MQFSVRYNWGMVISGLVDFRGRRSKELEERRNKEEVKAGGKCLKSGWCIAEVQYQSKTSGQQKPADVVPSPDVLLIYFVLPPSLSSAEAKKKKKACCRSYAESLFTFA